MAVRRYDKYTSKIQRHPTQLAPRISTKLTSRGAEGRGAGAGGKGSFPIIAARCSFRARRRRKDGKRVTQRVDKYGSWGGNCRDSALRYSPGFAIQKSRNSTINSYVNISTATGPSRGIFHTTMNRARPRDDPDPPRFTQRVNIHRNFPRPRPLPRAFTQPPLFT